MCASNVCIKMYVCIKTYVCIKMYVCIRMRHCRIVRRHTNPHGHALSSRVLTAMLSVFRRTSINRTHNSSCIVCMYKLVRLVSFQHALSCGAAPPYTIKLTALTTAIRHHESIFMIFIKTPMIFINTPMLYDGEIIIATALTAPPSGIITKGHSHVTPRAGARTKKAYASR